MTGIGFDRDTLREAGIEEAQAFAAVSSGDNSNILAARVARETFGVDNVVARIYDPRPRRGLPAAGHPHRRDGALDRRPDAAPAAARTAPSRSGATPAAPSGSPRSTSTRPGSVSGSAGWRRRSGARVAFLTRLGEGLLPERDTVLQDGDLVHVVMRDDDADARRGRAAAPCTGGALMRVAIAGAGSVGPLDRPRAARERPRGAAHRQDPAAIKRTSRARRASGCSPTRARSPRSRRPACTSARSSSPRPVTTRSTSSCRCSPRPSTACRASSRG